MEGVTSYRAVLSTVWCLTSEILCIFASYLYSDDGSLFINFIYFDVDEHV